MKNILKKASKFFLTTLVILNSMTNTLSVHAQETDSNEDYSEATETITQLGTVEDVFPEAYEDMYTNPYARLTPGFASERLARINGMGVYGYDYIRKLTVDGMSCLHSR